MNTSKDPDPCPCRPQVGLGKDRAEELVVAKVPQGFELNINVRLVPGGDFALPKRPLRCRPRKGAPRRDAEPLALPEEVMKKLQEADKVMMEWLAKDEANASLYMAHPVEALLKAGVKLSRQELKAVERAHGEVEQTAVVGPGVKVAGFKAAAFPRGRIGEIKPGAKPQDDDGFAVHKEG